MESSQRRSARIIDMHTHAQPILLDDPGYVAWMERLASATKGRGVVRAWERFGYRPTLANRLTTWASAPLTAFEIQLRDVIADPERLRRTMRAAGVGRAVMLPIEPVGSSDEVLSLGRAFPELLPLVSVHPERPAAADRLDALLASDPRFARGETRAAARSDAELEQLLWGNAERLLGLPAAE